MSYWSQWRCLVYKDGLIFRLWEDERTGQQLCLPRKLAPQVLCALHDNPSAGHLGVTKTLERVQKHFHWLGVREDVENHVRICVAYVEVNDPPKLPRAPLINVKAGHPLQRVAIDIIGPMPKSSSGHEWLLVVSHHFTKFTQAFPLRNTYIYL